MKHICRNCR